MKSKLINANSLDWLKKCANNTFDCVITDPPYLLENKKGYVTNINQPWKRIKPQRKDFTFLESYDIEAYLNEFARVSKNIYFVIFCSEAQLLDYLIVCKKNKWLYKVLLWEKANYMSFPSYFLAPDKEIILFIYKTILTDETKQLAKKTIIRGMTRDLHFYGNDKYQVHPTIKPDYLMTYLIKKFSNKNWLILDPFGGSGSTYYNAIMNDRLCVSIELNKKYYDDSVKLLEYRLKTHGKQESLI